jgi:hypothetical protein
MTYAKLYVGSRQFICYYGTSEWALARRDQFETSFVYLFDMLKERHVANQYVPAFNAAISAVEGMLGLSSPKTKKLLLEQEISREEAEDLVWEAQGGDDTRGTTREERRRREARKSKSNNKVLHAHQQVKDYGCDHEEEDFQDETKEVVPEIQRPVAKDLPAAAKVQEEKEVEANRITCGKKPGRVRKVVVYADGSDEDSDAGRQYDDDEAYSEDEEDVSEDEIEEDYASEHEEEEDSSEVCV